MVASRWRGRVVLACAAVAASDVRNVTAVSAGASGMVAAGGGTSPVVDSIAQGPWSTSTRPACGGQVDFVNGCFPTFNDAAPPFGITARVSAGLGFRAIPTNLRQAAASTTIDAGTATGGVPGQFDLDGNLRIVGGAPDPGAYEDVFPPSTAGTVEVAGTTATVSPPVTAGGGRTEVTVACGTTAGAPPTR